MIQRPPGMGGFQFVVLATLRAAQLMRGCRPRVDGDHKATIIAQMEVSEGMVTQMPYATPAISATSMNNVAPVDDGLMVVGAA